MKLSTRKLSSFYAAPPEVDLKNYGNRIGTSVVFRNFFSSILLHHSRRHLMGLRNLYQHLHLYPSRCLLGPSCQEVVVPILPLIPRCPRSRGASEIEIFMNWWSHTVVKNIFGYICSHFIFVPTSTAIESTKFESHPKFRTSGVFSFRSRFRISVIEK